MQNVHQAHLIILVIFLLVSQHEVENAACSFYMVALEM